LRENHDTQKHASQREPDNKVQHILHRPVSPQWRAAAANPMPTSPRARPSHQTWRRSVKPSWHRSTVGNSGKGTPGSHLSPRGKKIGLPANAGCFLDRTHAKRERLADRNHAFNNTRCPCCAPLPPAIAVPWSIPVPATPSGRRIFAVERHEPTQTGPTCACREWADRAAC
jgi:hypothetical protein